MVRTVSRRTVLGLLLEAPLLLAGCSAASCSSSEAPTPGVKVAEALDPVPTEEQAPTATATQAPPATATPVPPTAIPATATPQPAAPTQAIDLIPPSIPQG